MGAPRVPPLNPSETIVLSEHYRLKIKFSKILLDGPHTSDQWNILSHVKYTGDKTIVCSSKNNENHNKLSRNFKKVYDCNVSLKSRRRYATYRNKRLWESIKNAHYKNNNNGGTSGAPLKPLRVDSALPQTVVAISCITSPGF